MAGRGPIVQDLVGRGNELGLYFACDVKLTALNRGVRF